MARRGKNSETVQPQEAGHQGVGVYTNTSNTKLHTSMGVVWPRKDVILSAEEAKTFGGKLMMKP